VPKLNSWVWRKIEEKEERNRMGLGSSPINQTQFYWAFE
jgi:hypothetical protein